MGAERQADAQALPKNDDVHDDPAPYSDHDRACGSRYVYEYIRHGYARKYADAGERDV